MATRHCEQRMRTNSLLLPRIYPSASSNKFLPVQQSAVKWEQTLVRSRRNLLFLTIFILLPPVLPHHLKITGPVLAIGVGDCYESNRGIEECYWKLCLSITLNIQLFSNR